LIRLDAIACATNDKIYITKIKMKTNTIASLKITTENRTSIPTTNLKIVSLPFPPIYFYWNCLVPFFLGDILINLMKSHLMGIVEWRDTSSNKRSSILYLQW
jgi:hypothetical protein